MESKLDALKANMEKVAQGHDKNIDRKEKTRYEPFR